MNSGFSLEWMLGSNTIAIVVFRDKAMESPSNIQSNESDNNGHSEA